MSASVKVLAAQAMEHSPEDRAQLADLLLESLDQAALSSADRAWTTVARRRRDEVRRGAVEPVPGEIAL